MLARTIRTASSLRYELEKQRKAIINNLEVGQILIGTVKKVTHYGAFIDLGGITGLLYIKEINWDKYLSHPNDVIDEEGNPLLVRDKKIKVVVIDFDVEKGFVSLSIKPLLDNPWEKLPEEIKEGAVVTGKVIKRENNNVVKIAPYVEGFIKASNLSYS